MKSVPSPAPNKPASVAMVAGRSHAGHLVGSAVVKPVNSKYKILNSFPVIEVKLSGPALSVS